MGRALRLIPFTTHTHRLRKFYKLADRIRDQVTRRPVSPTVVDEFVYVHCLLSKSCRPEANSTSRSRFNRFLTVCRTDSAFRDPRSAFEKCRGGEIGRRTRLRIWRRKTCEFESRPRHHISRQEPGAERQEQSPVSRLLSPVSLSPVRLLPTRWLSFFS